MLPSSCTTLEITGAPSTAPFSEQRLGTAERMTGIVIYC